jgi:acylphosphatase
LNVIRHVLVRGRVQGVGYRAFIEREAMQLGLAGWVRNRRDGATVEAVFCGEERVVALMIEACRRGPRGSRVDAVDVVDGGDLAGQGAAFAVLPTV